MMFPKVEDAAWLRCSSHRRTGRTSGCQKDRGNYGRLPNTDWAFSSKCVDGMGPSRKAVGLTECGEETKELIIQWVLKSPCCPLSWCFRPPQVFISFFYIKDYHSHFILRNETSFSMLRFWPGNPKPSSSFKQHDLKKKKRSSYFE